MKFANPVWLWALAALPLVYFLLSWDERRRKRQFELFAAQAVWSRVAPEADSGARLRKARFWVLGMAFLIAAMARPQWGTHEEVVHVSGLDIMIVLDVSNSMEVEDVVPNRLKKAQHLIKSITERLRGDRVGAVAFAGSAFVASPLTTDLDYLGETVSILNPKMVTNQGTDIGIGLETARKALERGAEEVRPSGAPGELGNSSSHAVILLSDGEDFEDGAVEGARQLKAAGIKTYVIGVGTEKGGPIPLRDETGNLQGYKRDRSGQPVVSTFRPDALMQVASAAGGRYWNASGGEGEVSEILQDLGALNRSDYAERRYLVYEDRFQIPLAIGVLLLLLELSIPARRLSSRDRLAQRREQEAVFGRIALPVLALATMLSATPARALSWAGKQPPLDVYLDNEKGLKAYKSGDVETAKQQFGAAQAKDPSLPELQFNRGVVQLKEGDLDGSIEAFANAAAAARGAGGTQGPTDEKLAGQSFYNLGAALAKKGDFGKAVGSYVEAIRSAQATGDPALEKDARKNIELLVQQQQQQKQQQKEQQEQQQKEKQEQQKQDQQQKQNQNQNQNQDQKEKEQAKRYDDKKQKQFKSEKLSPEDADRVMAELTNKERELQTKLKQQRANSTNNGKDW
jgi:Ca-activated chloride channel family protein